MIFIKRVTCVINQKKDDYTFNFICYKTNSSIGQIVKTLTYTLTKEDIHTEQYKSKIMVELSEIGFLRSKTSVNFDIDHVFFEKILIPKLNTKEQKKALEIEMTKLYGKQYKKQYVIDALSTKISKGVYENYFALCEKKIYKEIIKFLSDLKLNLEDVSLMACKLKQYISKKKMIQTSKTSLIINISSDVSHILVVKNNYLLHQSKINVGTINLEESISNGTYQNLEEASRVKHLINRDKLRACVLKEFKDIVNAYLQISCSALYDIQNVYLNYENIDPEDAVKNILIERLGIENSAFLTTDENNKMNLLINSCTANLKDNEFLSFLGKHNYLFPVKVK